MKPHLFALTLFIATLWAAGPVAAQPQAPVASDDYKRFVEQLVKPENLADCISKMDGLIDEVEHLSALDQGATHGINAETNIGLHLAFCVFTNKEEVLYYLIISRDGQELSPAAAVNLAALFCDRAGLPHPVTITEGEKPIFYIQWHIRHSDWHAMKKKMLEVRAVNRAEKDPQKAFVAAIISENNARQASSFGGP
jgi:hypothetical protein